MLQHYKCAVRPQLDCRRSGAIYEEALLLATIPAGPDLVKGRRSNTSDRLVWGLPFPQQKLVLTLSSEPGALHRTKFQLPEMDHIILGKGSVPVSRLYVFHLP